MKKILSLLLLAPMLSLAQTTSQVSGNFSENMTFTLQATNPVGSASFPLAYQPVIQGALTYGSNGVGIGNANQLFAGYFPITNGAGAGTNVLNLNTMILSPQGSFLPTNDYVGNPFSVRNIKMVYLQNVGTNASASLSESNEVDVILPPSAIAWTNVYGHPFIECVLPSPSGAPSVANATGVTFWCPGDVGWPVGLTASNSIFFTNPISGTVSYVKAYFIGSTNQ
jgi:hypothetical protein